MGTETAAPEVSVSVAQLFCPHCAPAPQTLLNIEQVSGHSVNIHWMDDWMDE